MDNNAIEKLAVIAVEKSITICDYLSPFIADNDKEPSWDGFIYIYKNINKKKNQIKGRVPVQVKGKLVTSLSRTEITYQIEVADLNNYLNEGGTFFFVVHINQNTNEEKIYFNALSPVKLKHYLSGIKKQITKSIDLKEFPCDNIKKSEILLNFYESSVRQKSFANTPQLLIEDLKENNNLTKWTIPFSGYCDKSNKIDPVKALFENEVYLYAEIKGSNILHPVDFIPNSIEVTESVNENIIVDGIKFYNKFTRTRTIDKLKITFGTSFSIIINHNDNAPKIEYTQSPMLRQRAKDLDFTRRAIKVKEFYVENKRIPVLISEKELEKFDFILQEESLKYYQKMIKVLDVLNICVDLNLEEMKDNEIQEFNNLIIAFVDNKPVANLKNDLSIITKIKISNLTILLVFIKCGPDDSTYKICDFFHSELVYSYKGPNDEHLPTSCFSMLNKQDYLDLSNIDYNSIVPSFKSLLIENERIFEIANNTLLEMLMAFDENKADKLLKTSKDLAEWIYKADTWILPSDLKLINYLQVVRRERELNKEEIKKLYLIIEDNSSQEDFKVGAYLLMDNFTAAEIHFEKMDVEEQKKFRKYPIFNFWKEMKNI